MSYRIGIDVGGTFTDFLLIDDDDTRLVHKTSSTPDDPSRGFVNGLTEIAAIVGLELPAFMEQLSLIVHGTTVTTNAVLTHRGARTGLLATEGFRDTLALRDGTREEPYDNRMAPPTPLVPRHLRLGVGGRMDYKGDELAPLAQDDVRAAAEAFTRDGVQAVAISFMHSPANAAHEARARDLIAELMPGVYVTASTDLLPQVRYYERTSTTVLNAYVGPIISGYLSALTGRLQDLAFGGTLLIMQSNGGVATPAEISQRAALSLLSGPASGPTAGLWQLAPHGLHDCITVDMGGTSFDAALVADGEPLLMVDGVVDRWRLALPTIDIHTIGAGGGSIAWVDDGGLLHVGPQSAGAQPGPACYGRGGTLPTVTDADLLLGFLGDDSFSHGGLELHRDAAEAAYAPLAERLNMTITEAAAGVYQLVNVTMATGVRDISVRRGLDPRDFPLVIAGGAGPLHAAAIAAELDCTALLVPRESSIFCAAGMLMSDFKHDHVRAFKRPLAEADPGQLAALVNEMTRDGRATLQREGVAADAIAIRGALDLRYVGQWHELTVAVELPIESGAVTEGFHAEHDRLFGHSSPQAPIEVLAVRVSVVGETPKPAMTAPDADDGTAAPPPRRRPVWSASARALVDTPVHDGQVLHVGTTIPGPAIIELDNTTIVVPESFTLDVDAYGAFAVHSGERGAAFAAQLHQVGDRDPQASQSDPQVGDRDPQASQSDPGVGGTPAGVA
jgi:N-methylhydantoinase A